MIVTQNTFNGRAVLTGAAARAVVQNIHHPAPLGGLAYQVTALRQAAAVCAPLAPARREARAPRAEERLAALVDAVASVLPEASPTTRGLSKVQIADALGWERWPVERALTAGVNTGRINRHRGRGAADVTYTLPGARK